MPFLHLRILPEQPVTETIFGASISGLQFELYNLQLDNLEPGEQISPISSTSLTQQSGKSVANIVFELPSLSDEYDRYDLRVVIKDSSGNVIMDEVLNHNTELLDASPGNVEKDRPSAYLFIPTLSSGGIFKLPKDGSAPKFDDLKNAVQQVIASDTSISLSINTLSLEQCRHIALELMWGNRKNLPPKPVKKEKKLYTLDEDAGNDEDEQDEKFIQARDRFEGDLEAFKSKRNSEAEQLTKYIWALRCAFLCEQKTLDTIEIQFRFPVIPQYVSTGSTPMKELRIQGNFSGNVTVPAEYFYALGVEMPVNMDWEFRFNTAVSTEDAILIEVFTQAIAKGLIPVPTINKWQAFRRLYVLKLNLNNGLIAPLLSGSADYPDCDPSLLLMGISPEGWLNYTGSDTNAFWGPLNSSFDEPHCDLVIFDLVKGDKYLFKVLDDVALTVNDLAILDQTQWATYYLQANADKQTDVGEDLNLPFLPKGKPEERARAFAHYAQAYFNAASASIDPVDPIIEYTPPVFGIDGPIEQYLSVHPLGTNATIDSVTIATIFPDDYCAQEWLAGKISSLEALYAMTSLAGIQAPDQQCLMEALYARGFINKASVAALSLADFTAALTGTVAYEHALEIYLLAGGGNQLMPLLVNCSNNSPISQPAQQIVGTLTAAGYTDAGSIATISLSDFAVTGIDPACLESIHTAATESAIHTLLPIVHGCDLAGMTDEEKAALLLSYGYGDPGSIAGTEQSVFVGSLQGTPLANCAPAIHAAATLAAQQSLISLMSNCSVQEQQYILNLLMDLGYFDAGNIAVLDHTTWLQIVDQQPDYKSCLLSIQNTAQLATQAELSVFASPCANAPGQSPYLQVLVEHGFTRPKDICKLTYTQFSAILQGLIPDQCLEQIYIAAGGNPGTPDVAGCPEVFIPVNDGCLVNCIPPAHLSPLGPTAYLHELLLASSESTCETPLIDGATDTLAQYLTPRRGDLTALQVSAANTNTPIPLLDQINEQLENMVATGTPQGAVYNTSIDKAGGHHLIQAGKTCQENPPEGFTLHDPVELFAAMPEHSTPTLQQPQAYIKLKSDFSDACHLPYHQALDVSRTYLDRMGLSRFDVLRRYRKEIRAFFLSPQHPPAQFDSQVWRLPLAHPLAYEYLCFSQEEYDLLFAEDLINKTIDGLPAYYHLYGYMPDDWSGTPSQQTDEAWIKTVSNLCEFLERTCLSYCEFFDLWQSGFIGFMSDQPDQLFPECEPCCCGDYQLVMPDGHGHHKPLTKEELIQLMVFIRLWRKMQCVPGAKYNFAEFRDICEVLELYQSGAINPKFLYELAHFQWLRDQYALPLTDGTAGIGTGASNTHLLALWAGAPQDKLNWAIDVLLDAVQQKSQREFDCACRPPEFIKILKENLDPLSELACFSLSNPGLSWKGAPHLTATFAEVLSKVYASTFSIGELFFLFTTKPHLVGDDPYILPAANEAQENPLELPDDDAQHALWQLRKHLLAVEVSDVEIEDWSWMKIVTTLHDEFGYEPAVTGDHLQSLGAHFFYDTLIAEGNAINTADRRYRTPLATTSSPLWNEQNSPFRYDLVTHELWTELPMLTDEAVIAKLSRIRKLDADEIKAVQELNFMPRLDMAYFRYIFSNFTEAQERLLQEPHEPRRWRYFRENFALFYKRCQVIAAHLADHVVAATGQPGMEGTKMAWEILKRLYADENRGLSTWEDANGPAPDVVWKPFPNGGAFAALTGLTGTGLLGNFTTLDGNLIWREVRGGMDAFGEEENGMDAPFPTVIPDTNLNGARKIATVRNGFAIKNQDGALLGGAQGYVACWEGLLLVEEGGSYTFRAGAPTPGEEIPDFKKAEQAQWSIELQRGQKRMILIQHNMPDQSTAPSDCSAPVQLKRGVYEITVKYVQPEPTLDNMTDGCPQTTGFQIKYTGPDTAGQLTTIPIERLYVKKKDTALGDGIAAVSSSANHFLNVQYVGSMRDFLRTYTRAFASLLLAHRLKLSAENIADDGQSEIGYLLSKPSNFAGSSFYKSGTTWKIHKADLNVNLLPVLNNYCPPDPAGQDKRAAPTTLRSQALFDWFIRLFDYTQLRKETQLAPEQPAWLALKESSEAHEDASGHFLRHLGIDLRHTLLVSNFFGPYTVTSADLEDERWAIRVWEAEKGLRTLLCKFSPVDITQARPLLWAATDPDESFLLEDSFNDTASQSGNQNLCWFVRCGLIENGEPKRYDDLKKLNTLLRERARKAMVAYLTRLNRVPLPWGGYAGEEGHLSELLLLDVEAGECQHASRIETAISAVQTYVQRSRLSMESGFTPTSAFRRLWEKRFESFARWEKCRRREIYRENWIEFEKTEEARRSEAFQLLEDSLRNKALSVPVSGGLTVLSTPPPPQHKGLPVLQKRAPSTMIPITGQHGFDLLGTPQSSASPSWLADLPAEKLPFWLEAAVRLKVPFIRVAAAGMPLAGITYDCHSEGCCATCGEIHPPVMDEYYFWLITSKYYHKIKQDAAWDWNIDEMLPSLLHMNTENQVYLAWTRKHNGEFQPMRWSSEGLPVSGSYDLSLFGRLKDSLHFEVSGAQMPVGILPCPVGNPLPIGFRYDIVTDSAVPIPAIGQPNCYDPGLISWSGYFAYFQPGAPLVPVSVFAPAVAVAQVLESQCRYEDALHWYEQAIHPLKEDNRWNKCASNQDCCCEPGDVSESEFARRALLLKYIESLLNWGKHLLQKNTGESIQQASVIFEAAEKILGECPKTVNATWDDTISQLTIKAFVPMAAPLNPRLICLYEQLADGLASAHHCRNQQRLRNMERDSNYWTNALTPAICSADESICADDYWCVPRSPYRFMFLISKSLELTGAVSTLGNALASAFKEGDAEYLANLREGQTRQLLELTTSIKEKNAREANWQVQALEKTLEITQTRLAYYQLLIANGLIMEEEDYKTFIDQSMISQGVAQTIEAATATTHLIPDSYLGSVSFLHTTGGEKIAKFILTGARVASLVSSIQGTRASKRLTTAGWTRRLQEWEHQVDVLTIEVEQVKRQLLAAQLREMTALRDLNNHRVQLVHAQETHDFMRDKFTSRELYLWMQKELTGMHRQMFECAVQTAYQAQRAYNRERGYTNDRFLDHLIWDNMHEGLLSGERLQEALRRMEKSYLDNNTRRYELTKHISLRHNCPNTLLQLVATGSCEVNIPETLFDMDNPGHYLRMLKSVSITIPCVVGPYTTVNCRLTLLSSKIRINPRLHCEKGSCCESCKDTGGYHADTPDDTRFTYEFISTESIATSTGQNDSGVFQLDFHDERNLPFEHYGVISRWRIELPKEHNYFDMQTISDVILHLSYTAKEGGEPLRQKAIEASRHYLPGDSLRLFDLKNDKPDAWYAMESSDPHRLPLHFGRNDFPYLPYKHDMKISRMDIFVEAAGCEPCDHLEVFYKDSNDCKDCDDIQVKCVRREDWGGLYHGVLEKTFGPLGAPADYGSLVFPGVASGIHRVYVLCTYEVERTGCAVVEKGCGC